MWGIIEYIKFHIKHYFYTYVQRTHNMLEEYSNTYKITYYIGEKEYLILVDKTKTRPRNMILKVEDSNGVDITQCFMKYYGPMYDFHGSCYRPIDIGMKDIIIHTINGIKINIETNEYICI